MHILRSIGSLTVALLLASVVAVGSSSAASSLADIKKQLDGGASELAEVDALLADTDKNRRIAAMTLLLNSDNPAFVRRAKEVGLLSSDPEMREVALKAVFDAGGAFRFVFDLSGASNDDKKKWKKYLVDIRGTLVGDVVTIAWDLEPFNEDQNCYKVFNRGCLLRQIGDRVQLTFDNQTGDLALDPEGRLSGAVSSQNFDSPISVTAALW